MKAIIENKLISSKVNMPLCIELTGIIDLITRSNDENELRENFKRHADGQLNNFVYGFGSNHMWVYQITNGQTHKQRLILVEF